MNDQHEPVYKKENGKPIWCCERHAQLAKNLVRKPKKSHPWITGFNRDFKSKQTIDLE